MYRISFLFALLYLTSCSTSKTVNNSSSEISTSINEVKREFAPDGRTVLFSVEQKGNVLKGETNIPQAKAALLNRITGTGKPYIDSIAVLPSSDLSGLHFGVVNISVANLRSLPKHSAELATQATLGTPVKVLKKNSGWYLVQTPDLYLSWVDAGGIKLMDSTAYASWTSKEKVIYTEPFGFVMASSKANSSKVSDVVMGNVFEVVSKEAENYHVKFPDGRTGFIKSTEATPYHLWANGRVPSENNFIQAAKELMGVPYLWGGTSFKGVDCSGFTKTVYFMNGLVLPRDASQQVMIGTDINTSNGWQNLMPGDLLFFGVPAQENRPEKVVHVAIWIGGGEFIHASGRVQIASLQPGAPNYDGSEHKRFLRAKRISPNQALMDLRKASFYTGNL